ncbi:hypothetical protein [Rubellimicrobium mesophilum]|uniref:hypothetical protein n=1 Tax=Rubellimicrobium mesophilum TaxID=1123067 RepID=UPI0005657ABB|nr:hypothetical protein [Rubellimicrobium mesophilum]
MDLLSDAAISLHLGSPQTALIASTFRGKLPILMMQRSSSSLRMAREIHWLDLPSHLVVLDVAQTSHERYFEPLTVLSACSLPQPELLVVGPDLDPQAVWSQLRSCETLTRVMFVKPIMKSLFRLQQHSSLLKADIGEDFAVLTLRANASRDQE